MAPLYHPKDTLIQMFKTLCDSHPNLATYVSIGKSFQGRDIWLFRIGNPNGGRVGFDGSLHGWEDLGSECEFLYAQWLLESGEAEALRVLNNNWTLIIPIINMDSTERCNADTVNCNIGVDLNRNWKEGWTARTCANSQSAQNYPGVTFQTEPEVLAVLSYFNTYKPKSHLNIHHGGGPWLGYYNLENATLAKSIDARIRQLTPAQPPDTPAEIRSIVCPYELRTTGAGGTMYGDCHNAGVMAWILEACGDVPSTDSGAAYMHRYPTINAIQTLFFPGLRAIFLAMSEAFEVVKPKKYAFSHWQDGDTNPTKTVIV